MTKKVKTKLSLSIGMFFTVLGLTIFLSVGATYGIMTIQQQFSPSLASSVLPERLVTGLSKSYALMKKTYMGELDENKLIDGALTGFVSGANDTYTSYLNESDWASLQQATDSSFEGIGVEVEKSGDFIRVVSPYDNAPASKAGLKTDDLIIAVDGKSIAGQTLSEMVSKVRGPKGSSVTLTIRRGTTEFDVAITRDTIPLTTVSHRLDEHDKAVGVIRLSSFSKTTYDELVSAIKDLRTQGAKSFVIDVRSNPGGLLDAVQKVINIFVDNGSVMFQMEDKEKGVQTFKASDRLGTFKVKEPVAVLINKGSASAAEIFASALSELQRAKLFGSTTYGKGTAQTIYPLTDTTGIKITYSKWLTSKGIWIHQKGFVPDETVELPAYSQLAVINPTLTYPLGEKSDAILNVQKVLQALDYTVQLTGSLDEQTQTQLKAFQQKSALQVSGSLDEATITALNKQLAEKIKANDMPLKKAVESVK